VTQGIELRVAGGVEARDSGNTPDNLVVGKALPVGHFRSSSSIEARRIRFLRRPVFNGIYP